MRYPAYPMEYVVWDDHYSRDDWTHIADHDNKYMEVHSIGWLIKEDDKCLTLALNLGRDDIVSCAMVIIKANIKHRKRLRGARKERKERRERDVKKDENRKEQTADVQR